MKPFNIIHIRGSLYLSNKVWLDRDIAILHQYGIGAIVNLVEDHAYNVPPPMVCLNCGFPDSIHITSDKLQKIYSFIELHRRRTNVLVHCSAGVSRSAGILVGQLMIENPNWTWKEAHSVVNERRAIWVSEETRESVLSYLETKLTPPPQTEIQERDAEALRQLQSICGHRLRRVSSIGWNTRGYTIEAGRVVGLGLYNLNLSVFPKVTHHLTMMRNLQLCDNRLEALRGEIAEFPHLQNLNLYGNQLTSLPNEIDELMRLSVLNVARNRLNTIPDGIRKLSKLDHLYLHENCITSLPEGFGKLAEITELYLQNNKLIHLPDNMGGLFCMRRLAINGNDIHILPDSIFNLPHLTTLNLAQNHIAALPNELGKSSELDNLNISGNQLETLPNSIVALNKLRRLNIALNRFNVLPDSIERWLEKLYDRGCIVIRGGVNSELL